MYRRESLWPLLYTELFYRPSVCCCPALFVGWLCTIFMHQIKSPLPPRRWNVWPVFCNSQENKTKQRKYQVGHPRNMKGGTSSCLQYCVLTMPPQKNTFDNQKESQTRFNVNVITFPAVKVVLCFVANTLAAVKTPKVQKCCAVSSLQQCSVAACLLYLGLTLQLLQALTPPSVNRAGVTI